MDDNIIDFTKGKATTPKEEVVESTTFEIMYKNHDDTVTTEEATGVWYETGSFIYVIEPMTEKTRMLTPVFGIPASSLLKVTKVVDKTKMN